MREPWPPAAVPSDVKSLKGITPYTSGSKDMRIQTHTLSPASNSVLGSRTHKYDLGFKYLYCNKSPNRMHFFLKLLNKSISLKTNQKPSTNYEILAFAILILETMGKTPTNRTQQYTVTHPKPLHKNSFQPRAMGQHACKERSRASPNGDAAERSLPQGTRSVLSKPAPPCVQPC